MHTPTPKEPVMFNRNALFALAASLALGLATLTPTVAAAQHHHHGGHHHGGHGHHH